MFKSVRHHEGDEVEEFHEEISKIMSESKSYYNIVMGDFNAKVGGHQQGGRAVERGMQEKCKVMIPTLKEEDGTIQIKKNEM